MNHQLDIQPRELRFVVEVNKQSKSTILLVNKTDQYVGFKVKTTSPKKYCVKPNVGVVRPKATYEFVVIMQAPKEVLADLTCKDKFLIQNTIVPEETTDENLTSEMFSRENGRVIEERKLRVILTTPSPPQSSELSTNNNGTEKQQKHGNLFSYQADGHVEAKTSKTEDVKAVKASEVGSLPNVKSDLIENARIEPSKVVEPNELKEVECNSIKELEPTTREIADVKVIEPRVPVGEEEQRLFKEVEEMKVKLHKLESKLNKTEATISKVTEERKSAVREKESLQHEMAFLKKRKVERRVQDGFPLLFVCMVALISLVVGYGFHP